MSGPFDIGMESHGQSLADLFERQVEATPNAVAVSSSDGLLSYEDLNEAANRIAHLLTSMGVGCDSIVGVMMTRSHHLSAALWGIQKAQAAYLPLDSDLPEARLRFLLEDAGIDIVLTQEELEHLLIGLPLSFIAVDSEEGCLDAQLAENPIRPQAEDPLAYLIYTSGSTGKPKGCLIRQKAIVNRLNWMQRAYPIGSNDTVLQKTPYTFDVSVWELFWPHLTGARLFFAKPDGHKDPRYLMRLIEDEAVTVVHFVPTMLRLFLAIAGEGRCLSLRHIVVSGEALSYDLMELCHERLPHALLHNLYGPTEAAVDVTHWSCKSRTDRLVPIGEPIDGATIHILNEDLTATAEGQIGEICISGKCLAEGYLNRPDLTRAAFVEAVPGAGGRRIYRTGDLGRILPGGLIEYRGRTDSQVKIRGQRVELGEVEAALLDIEEVRAAAVLLREEAGDQKLVAYAESDSQPSDPAMIRARLKDILPPHMVPNVIHLMERLPVSAHGKIDRKSLPWPLGGKSNAPPAASGVLEVIVEEAARLLPQASITPDADLFELGASSLTLASLAERLFERFGIELPFELLIDAPTPARLAREIERGEKTAPELSSPPAEVTAPLDAPGETPPAASAQAAVLAFIGDELGLRVSGPSDDLFDAGATSLGLVRLIEWAHTEFGADLDVDAMLDNPTPALVAEAIIRAGTQSPILRAPSQDREGPPRIAFDALASALCAFMTFEHEGKAVRHYASSGDLTPVQVYLRVESQAVEGLKPGSYYYHPDRHALIMIDTPGGGRESDGDLSLYFVAELAAVAPLYGAGAGPLCVLEAGYMARALACRLPAAELEAVAMARDVEDASSLDLAATQEIVQRIALKPSGTSSRSSVSIPFHVPDIRASGASFEPVRSEAEKEALKAAQKHIRSDRPGDIEIALPKPVSPQIDDYLPRKTSRHYAQSALSMADLEGLCREIFANDTQETNQGYSFRPYLFLKKAAGSLIGPGLYELSADGKIALRKVWTAKSEEALRRAYSPANRKIFDEGGASLLFLEAGSDAPPSHLALFEAGMIGQRLLERQRAMGIGICPIGGMIPGKLPGGFFPEAGGVVHGFILGKSLERDGASTNVGVRGKTPALTEIAVIGMDLALPGSATIEGFWEMLASGETGADDFPRERWLDMNPDAAEESQVRGRFFSDISSFDHQYFRLSPPEARSMDPQERMLLQSGHACFESAGYRPDRLPETLGRVGIYTGVMWEGYQTLGAEQWRQDSSVQAASTAASCANRLSFHFGTEGPSVSVNTSCSSAMSALHFAVTALTNGEIDAALVGGVNLVCHPYHLALLSGLDLLSEDGVAKPFAREADGWMLGEGVGTVLLKPMDKAACDRDAILAVIEGTALAHTGKTARYTAPSPAAQERAIRALHERTGVPLGAVGYIEAAAPGAQLADSAEFAALKAVYAGGENPCLIDTVKGAIGHLESASFVPQLARVILQMREGKILGLNGSRSLSALIKESDGVAVVKGDTAWGRKAGSAPRRALICANGATGSSGFALLREPPALEIAGTRVEAIAVPLLLSATNAEQLRLLAEALRHAIEVQGGTRPLDVAFSLASGRPEYPYRDVLYATGENEMLEGLAAIAAGEVLFECGSEGETPLDDLAVRWQRGEKCADILADALYDMGARRLVLPGTPLAGPRHWLQGKSPIGAALAERSAEARASVLSDLISIFSLIAEVPENDLDPGRPLSDYGINSLMITALNKAMEKTFGSGLSKALFYEHETLKAVGDAIETALRQDAHPSAVQGRHEVSLEKPAEETIAVVGMAGRYPKGESLSEFWEKLLSGADCTEELPAARKDLLRRSAAPDEVEHMLETYAPIRGGFLAYPDRFDPIYFGIPPRSAELMDPQARIFLEVAAETFEDAGYNKNEIRSVMNGEVAVFAGVMYSEYQLLRPANGGALAMNGTASPGSVAHQISYHFDLSGPSLAVDTMCSSSLTAIHLAAEALRRGECRAALAGGVNLSIHPQKYIAQRTLGMSSSDGRCRSFGKGGDGFAASEGAGAVLLKRLSDAMSDGDHICGIICATSVNAGGRTHGYTVPNPQAQSRLVRTALARAELHPDDIDYIEAHGTGTALGDPIEIAGLTAALADDRSMGTVCPIGSVKSNIGHCESAAGIAGLTKILLQLKHETLVPSLHAEEVNPNIDFEKTPFLVQKTSAPWPASSSASHAPSQRRALLLSFGAGGANACAIVGEAPARTVRKDGAEEDYEIPLSAESEGQLSELARRLQAFLENAGAAEADMGAICFTLWRGRESLPVRLLIRTKSIEELCRSLAAFARGKTASGRFSSSLASHGEKAAAALSEEGKAWLEGGAVPSRPAGIPAMARRMSLPTYPFAEEFYWIDGKGDRLSAVPPMTEERSRAGASTSLSATFSAADRLISDHVVGGQRVLPGVCHLDLALRAVTRAASESCSASGMALISSHWLRPLIIDDTEEVVMTVRQDGAIWRWQAKGGPGAAVLAEGQAEVRGNLAPPPLDLPLLRTRLTGKRLSQDDVYAAYRALGIDYGPSLQAICEIETGRDTAGRVQLLARLRPRESGQAPETLLDPGVLDPALQSVIGLFLSDSQDQDSGDHHPSLPYAVGRLQRFREPMDEMFAWVRESEANALSSGAKSLDVDLCTPSGDVCLQIEGFASRPMTSAKQASLPPEEDDASLHRLTALWQRADDLQPVNPACSIRGALIVERSGSEIELPSALRRAGRVRINRHLSIEDIADILKEKGSFTDLIWLPETSAAFEPHDAGLISHQHDAVLLLFKLVKAALSLGYSGRKLGLHIATDSTHQVVGHDVIRPADAAITGFVCSLAKEYPQWTVNLLDVEGTKISADDLQAVLGGYGGTDMVRIARRGGVFYRRSLVPVSVADKLNRSLQRKGVHVIIGGAGGLGRIYTRHLLKSGATQVVWIGRRADDEKTEGYKEECAAFGARPVYIRADAADRALLCEAFLEIKRRFGRIVSVVHAAVTLSDRGVEGMTERAFEDVLDAKVATSVNLAAALRPEEDTEIVFFSSAQSHVAAPGQSNYAAGCTFADSLALRLDQCGAHVAKVVNWGYWAEAGIVSSQSYRERMAVQGIGAITSSEGMKSLDLLTGTPLENLMVFKTMDCAPMPGVADRLECSVCPKSEASRLMAPDLGKVRALPRPAAPQEDRGAERALARLALARLLSLAPSMKVGDTPTPAGLGVAPAHELWFHETMAVAEEYGLVRPAVKGAVLIDLPSEEAAWKEWVTASRKQVLTDAEREQLALIERMMDALPDIVTGRRAAAEILFPASGMGAVSSVYQGNAVSDYFNRVVAETVASAIAPDAAATRSISIVEVGAGTGATSRAVLDRLDPLTERIGRYWYTDLSQAFLRHGEENLAKGRPHFKTAIFDLEKPPAGQSVPVGSQDLVIATNVLHATRNVTETLRHVQALLRPGGWLVLNEINRNTLFAHLTFGFLDGWWRAQDRGRRLRGSPVLSEAAWREVLWESGFDTSLVMVPNAGDLGQLIIAARSNGIVVTGKGIAEERTQSRGNPGTPIPHAGSREEEGADEMIEHNEEYARSLVRESLSAALKIPEGKIRDEKAFADYGVDSIVAVSLVNLINEAGGLSLPTTTIFDHPNVEALAGFIAAHHDLKPPAKTQEPQAKPAASPAHAAGHGASNLRSEPPAAEKPSVHHYAAAAHTSSRLTQQVPDLYFRRLQISGPGTVDDLRLDEAAMPLPGDGEVLVEVRAFSLNFADLLCAKGLYPTQPPYPFTPGFEASGVIVDVGRGAEGVAVGDEVVVATGTDLGGHAEFLLCRDVQATPKPAELSFAEAAALPTVTLTALDAFEKARPTAGESILIQSAAGGLGQIAIQLAHHHGLRVYATAGSRTKCRFLEEQGTAAVINYEETDFETELLHLTGGKGVDIVLNTLPGEAMAKGLRCLAEDGRYIEVAMTALKSARSVDLSVMSDNQSFHSVDLRRLGLRRPDRIKAYWDQMVRLIREGIIDPALRHELPFEQYKEAYRLLEERQNIGKVVVTLPGRGGALSRGLSDVPVRQADRPADAIAVIGMSGRFGSAGDLDAYWSALAEGRDLVTEASRWPLPRTGPDGRRYCVSGSFLADIDCFDPKFFNISGVEARFMDPQQRLVLEDCWHALEDAGYAGEALQGREVGVYAGYSGADYGQIFKDSGEIPAQAFWGNSGSVLASRISYVLNLKGPALAVDTACSSALVATHMACQALKQGEIDMALACSMFVQCTEGFHQSSNRAAMLSPTGKCHTFDAQADGFVPGEGGGAIVLKRLGDALRDRDVVHGVILGSGVNQDGATNGITAPSAASQASLMKAVHERNDIDADDITLIEAHGTGTVLGDPIEVDALCRIFATKRRERNSCALGSVKTNIGHTANSAGLAGLLKLLLALRHEQIPPSLHFRELNEKIDLTASPLFINTQLQDWVVPQGKRKMAAVSSFGFSGTNAHLVLAEAPRRKDVAVRREEKRELIVLSAQSAEQLRVLAERLALMLSGDIPDGFIGDAAYTLSVGRRHCQHRLALIARTAAEAVSALREWTAGRPCAVIDKAPVEERALTLKKKAKDLAERAGIMPAGRERDDSLNELGRLYVAGIDIPFTNLYRHGDYRRVSLPKYPFARGQFWALPGGPGGPGVRAEPGGTAVSRGNAAPAGMHRLAKTDPLLAEHEIAGRHILPGYVAVEWAFAAYKEGLAGKAGVFEVREVTWLRPVMDHDAAAGLTLTVDGAAKPGGGLVPFRLKAPQGSADGTNLFATGLVGEGQVEADLHLDLTAWRGVDDVVDAGDLYRLLEEGGIVYGPSFRAVVNVRMGTDKALAELQPAEGTGRQAGSYLLHPCTADAALHAAAPLLLRACGQTAFLAYGVDRITAMAETGEPRWAEIRLVERTEDMVRLDIDIADEAGRICTSIRGYSLRAAQPTSIKKGKAQFLAPRWRPIETPIALAGEAASIFIGGEDAGAAAAAHEAKVTLPWRALSDPEAILEKCRELAAERLILLPPLSEGRSGEELIRRGHRVLADVYRLLGAIAASDEPARPVEILLLTRGAYALGLHEGGEPVQAALHGLVTVAARENAGWRVATLDLASDEPLESISGVPAPGDQPKNLALRRGVFYERSLLPCRIEERAPPPYRQGGVYIVIGGAGGIGEAWTRHMMTKCGARIVWIGRRPACKEIEDKLEALPKDAPRPHYLQADAADPAAMEAAAEEVRRRFGSIDGVVHAAVGALDDAIAKMPVDRFEANLTAKLDGTVNMLEAFRSDRLDFMVFFSSTASFSAEHGKSAYVASSQFADCYAALKGRDIGFPVKIMNWGWWGGTGVANDVSAAHKRRAAKLGIEAIEPEEGMTALDKLLSCPLPAVAFLKLGEQRAAALDAGEEVVIPAAGDALRGPAAGELRAAAAEFRPQIAAPARSAAEKMERFTAQMLRATLREIGAIDGDGPNPARLAPRFAPWLSASLSFLESLGTGTYKDESLQGVPSSRYDLWREWEPLKQELAAFPELAAQCPLLEAALNGLPDILRGDRPATEILFPGGSAHLLEGVYARNAIADAFTEGLAACALRHIEAIGSSRDGIKILEIGAGTGSCSRPLFAKLKPYADDIAEYRFTDISRAFLNRAQTEFGGELPYLVTSLLDIGEPPAMQGIEEGTYDIVVAANVLHATKDIAETLGHVKALLRKGGLLLLIEIDEATLFNHLTFGLLEDWWDVRDPGRRIAGCPALDAVGWKEQLGFAGFENVDFPMSEGGKLGQQLICARSDGIYLRAPQRAGNERIVGAPAKPAAPRADDEIHALVAEELGLPQAEIHIHQPLSEYGLDSILVERITRRLRDVYPDIRSSLLFEAKSVAALTERLGRARSIGVAGEPDDRPADDRVVQSDILDYVTRHVAGALGFAPETIVPDESLASYGLDSIIIANITRRFRQDLGEVKSSLVFEAKTTRHLADALVASHGAALKNILGTAPTGESERPRRVSSSTDAFAADAAPATAHRGLRRGSARDAGPAPIAIIGLSGRFPMAPDLSAFWDNLCEGRECFSEIPDERWPLEGFYEPDTESAVLAAKSYSKIGGFIEGFADFDPAFFGITPKEAMNIDPQERLFLQCCWETMEDAGYTRASLNADGRRVGVYAGITKNDYNLYAPELWAQDIDLHPHCSFSSVANRVSYFFDLKGPSMPVDTMCSASLTAVHIACRDLRDGECDMAIAGGVNCYLHPTSYTALCALRMLSTDGKCRSFGLGGDGFVPGEGVGAVMLKPLDAAERDRDRIMAVILATGVNHGGRTSGFTVPNPEAQRELIETVIDRADIDPRTITVVEAHGTGTRLGDPIEAHSLEDAFKNAAGKVGVRLEPGFCALGSVKSNQGHAESAAGIAGLAKLVLQLKNKKIVPTLNVDETNPEIDFASGPFRLPKVATPWTRPLLDGGEAPRRGAVSSFGAGGSNAHVIVEEYEDVEPAIIPMPGPQIVLLSARSDEALIRSARRWVDALSTDAYGPGDLPHIAYTSQLGREDMPVRAAFAVDDLEQLCEGLSALATGGAVRFMHRGKAGSAASAFGALAEDDAVSAAMAGWAASGRHDKLLALWVQGLKVDWRRLWGDVPPRPIGLPAYCFDNRTYWLRSAGQPSPAVAAASGVDVLLDKLLAGQLSVEDAASAITAGQDRVDEDRVDEDRADEARPCDVSQAASAERAPREDRNRT